MDFGVISRQDEDIQLGEWNTVVDSNSFLSAVADREGIHPFTKEILRIPGTGVACYLQNGKSTGNIVLENGKLLTTGVPRTICEQIAGQLHASFHVDNRS